MDILQTIKSIATKINPHTMFYKEGVQEIHKPFVFKNRKKDEIKLLQYNIQMIPKVALMLNEHYPSVGQDERCIDIIRAIEDYDIVCLQEAFAGICSEIKDLLVSYATKAGFFYIVQDDEPGLFSSYLSDGGLMILSRFPIIARSYHPYSYSQDTDGLAMRGCLYARVNVEPKRNIHVFTTHMCSSHFYPPETGPLTLAQGLEARNT